jgi:pyruvate formate lyase activating enzyme
MRIGGVVSCSLSDFPGRIASVVFTQGCNWRCPWCHNPALVHPEQFTPALREADVLARFACSRGKIDGIVVTGGEPTLQPDLAGFFAQVRGLGFQTKLDTNGSRPSVVRALLEARYLDFVAVDVKAPWSRYAEAAGVAVDTAALEETIALLRSFGVEHQLRTTRWPGLTADDEPAIEAIVAGSPHVWQDFRPVINA